MLVLQSAEAEMTKAESAKAEQRVVRAAMRLSRRKHGIFVYGNQNQNMALVVLLDQACAALAAQKQRRKR